MTDPLLTIDASEINFKYLFDSAHDLIQVVDLNGKLVYFNQSWSRTLGYDLKEITDRSIYCFIHPDDRDYYQRYRQNVIEGRQKEDEILFRFLNKQGEIVYIEGHISLQQHNNIPQFTFAIFRDVTSKIKNEQQLKDREWNLHQLLINAPDAIIVIDPESNILFWNPAAENLFGWYADEVLHKPLSYTIIPPQYQQAHLRGMQRYLATNEAHVLNKTVDISAINKMGEEFYISLTISTTTYNNRPAFISFIRDIREKKRNEAELERKRQQLEASNKQLEQFAHVASHDMKEPVRKIRIFGGILKDELGSDISTAAKTYLNKIDVAAQRLYQMVDGVLKYATAQHTEELFETIDLNIIINSILLDLEVVIQQKEAVVKYNKLPSVYGVHFLVYQLFYNLINNSLKFAQTSVKPVINISSSFVQEIPNELNMETAPAYTQITIADNGIGFMQQYAGTIFKPFTRLNNRKEYDGTGLGLSLCKTIMERHNGTITATGEEGVGAKFTLIFPQLYAPAH